MDAEINKTCACGRVHTRVPANFRPWKEEEKLLFECECGSTLAVDCQHEEVCEDHLDCYDCGYDFRQDMMDALEEK